MKTWKRILAFVLCFVYVFSTYSSSIEVFAEEPETKNLTVGNSVVKFEVDRKNGRFSIFTEDGIPSKTSDNFQWLSFFNQVPETSFTTIRINNEDFIFGNDYGQRGGVIQNTIVRGMQAETIWGVDGVTVTQKLELVTDMANANVGNVKICYEIANGSDAKVEIGSRILLDTQLGSNDASAMLLNSAYVTNEKRLVKENIPQVWQSSDRKFASNVVSYGYLSGWENIEPDEMVVAHWNTLATTKWDCEINELLNFTTNKNSYGSADSAVALYYNPVSLGVGEYRVIETYYGIGSISDAVYSSEDYSVQIQAPQKLTLNSQETAYTKEPFEVAVLITNNTETELYNLDVQIGLSDALTLYGNENPIQTISCIDAGDTYRVAYQVEAAVQPETIVAEMGITVSCGENASQSMKYVILPGQKGAIPDMQITEVAPDTIYTKSDTKKVTIKGSSFKMLQADLQWSMYISSERTGEQTEISRANIAIADDATMTVQLPEELDYSAGDYKLYLKTQNYGNMSAIIHMTDDASYNRKEYGVMLIGGFEEDDGDVVYGVKLLESEEEMEEMTEEEQDAVLLTIRGEINSYESGGREYYTIGQGALINNSIKYINLLSKQSVITVTRYAEKDADSTDEMFRNQFSNWEWWGQVSDSLVLTGEGTLYVGDYAFHTGQFFVCFEDGELYELRGGELEGDDNNPDLNGDASNESDPDNQEKNDVEIITPGGVVGNQLSNLIGVLTGFRISVSNAVIGEETVSLGGSFSVELPWWSGGDDDDDDDDDGKLTAEQKKAKEKFDKVDDISGKIEGGPSNDSFVSLDMSEMRYGVKEDENVVELKGVTAEGNINLTDDSVPKFTKGGAGAGFKIDSINYPGWYMGINANMKVGDAFECEFDFSLVRENTGKCYPDTISFVAGGDLVRIPLGMVGFLTKMGGGIEGLYNTIKNNFNHFPPVTIKFVTGYADPTLFSFTLDTIGLSVGGSGISISAEEGKVVGLKILEEAEAHLLLYGYRDENGVITDCIDIGMGVKVNIVGIVRGESSLWLVYDPRIDGVFGNLSIGGKAYCGIFIPDWIPVLGGVELMAVMAELSTYRIYVGTRIIGIPLSVSYYWADGEVKFFDDWDYIAENFAIPLDDLENSLGVMYNSGETNVDGVMLFGDNLTKITYHEAKKRSLYEYEFEVKEHDYTLLQAAFNQEDLKEGDSILTNVKIYDPSGNEMVLIENENCLIQHIQKETAQSGQEEYNLGIGLVNPADGTWKICSEVPLTLTPYKVDELTGVTTKEITLEGSTLWAEFEATSLGEGYLLDAYLVEETEEIEELSQAELLEMSEEERQTYYKELSEKNPSGIRITKESIKLEGMTEGGLEDIVTIEIPDSMQSGSYKVRLVVSDESGSAVCSDVSEEAITFVNPHTPENVTNVVLTPGGDGQYHISWDEIADADGYFVQLLDENGQPLEDFEGVTTTDTSIYLGGEYTVPEYEVDEQGAYVITGAKEVGTPPERSYRALVYAYKEVNETIYPSQAIITEQVYLPKSNPAKFTYMVNDVNPVMGTMGMETGEYLQNDSFQVLSNTTDVELKITADQDVDLMVSVDNYYDEYTIYQVAAGETLPVSLVLPEGGSVVGILAKNEAGDYTRETIKVETDTIAPELMIDHLTVCSRSGSYVIEGTTEANARIYVDGMEQSVKGGTFCYEGSGNTEKETIEVCAVDAAGNETIMKCEVIPSELTKLVGLYLKSDDKRLDPEADVLELNMGSSTAVEIVGITEEGKEIPISNEKATFTVVYNDSVLSISETGEITGRYAGDAVISVTYPITETYMLEETLAVAVKAPIIKPAEIQSSSLMIDTTADVGSVAAHLIVPNAPDDFVPVYKISENDFLEIEGAYVRVKDTASLNETTNVVITAEGFYTDAEGNKQSAVISQEFTFRWTASVDEIVKSDSITVKIGTPYEELKLPNTTQIVLKNGETVETGVTWKKGGYNGNVSREYLLKGTLDLSENVTNYENKEAEIQIYVEKIEVANSARDTELVYEGTDIDVSKCFTIDEHAQEVSYEIIGGTGEGVLVEQMLEPVKAGTFRIRMTTAENSIYKENSVEALLTLQKGVQKAPASVIAMNSATNLSGTGAIFGLTEAMEYRRAGETAYHKISGTVIEGLEVGTYEIRYAETDLYEASEAVVLEIVANGKETQSDLVLNMPSEAVYGDGVLNAIVSGGDGQGDYIFTSENDQVIRVEGQTLKIVGAGETTITVTKEEDSNYNSISLSQKVTILPRVLSLVWSGTETREFDGEASNVTVLADNLLEGDSCKLIVENHDGVHAGSYEAVVIKVSNKNYKLPKNKSAKYIIEPKKTKIRWSDSQLIYNASDRAEDIYAEYQTIDGVYEKAVITVENPPMTAAGTYSVVAEIADKDYVISGSDTYTYTIEKAAPVIVLESSKQSGKKVMIKAVVSGVAEEQLTGEIEFFENDNSLGREFIKENQASIVLKDLSAGTYKITAVFIPDETSSNYWEAGSKELQIIVTEQGDILLENETEGDSGTTPLAAGAAAASIGTIAAGIYYAIKKRKLVGKK